MTTQTTAPPPTHTEFFPPPPPVRPARINWLHAVADDCRQLVRFWPVIQNMVAQDLRIRYHRSMLGFLWTLLNPVLMMLTLTVVFSQLFGVRQRDYALYLFSGMVPWGLLSTSLNDCSFCIIHNEGLIRKIYLPKLVFPLTRVLINLATFVLSLCALFFLLAPLGARFTLPMLLLPLAIVLFATFTLGLGLIVATMNTFFRDCSHLVNVFLQAWYFATPILYRPDQIESVARYLWVNPAYPFIDLFHVIICDGRWPSLASFMVAAGIAALALGVGYVAFKSQENKLIFRL